MSCTRIRQLVGVREGECMCIGGVWAAKGEGGCYDLGSAMKAMEDSKGED